MYTHHNSAYYSMAKRLTSYCHTLCLTAFGYHTCCQLYSPYCMSIKPSYADCASVMANHNCPTQMTAFSVTHNPDFTVKLCFNIRYTDKTSHSTIKQLYCYPMATILLLLTNCNEPKSSLCHVQINMWLHHINCMR